MEKKSLILHTLDKLRPEVQKFRIILIANTKETPLGNRPNSKDIWIEFFSDPEIDYLINALRSNELFTEVYFAEQEFIRDVLNHKYENLEELFVFNLARNGFGISKKSLIPSFCDLMNIKYSGSNAYVCSLARNKFHCSHLFQKLNCSGTSSWVYDSSKGWFLGEKPPKGTEVIIKPMFESASKGITKESIINTSDSQFLARVKACSMRNAEPMMVQKFIRGYECQVPFIKLDQDVFFQPIGIRIGTDCLLNDKIISEDLSYAYSYDYYAAYEKLDSSVCERMIQIAKKASEIVGIETYGRIDFRLDEQMNLYITDVATMPYIVEHSAFNHVFTRMGMSEKEIMLSIICSALIHKYHYVV